MPRGLGDDPLSRKKNSRRTASSLAVAMAPHPDDSSSSSVQPAVQTIESSPSPASPSYNDVFFQKRAETVPAASAAPTVAVTEPSPAPIAAAPIEAPAPQEPIAQTIAQPAPAPSAAIVPTSPEPAPTPTQPQPEAQKTGFFGRIFGRLRK